LKNKKVNLFIEGGLEHLVERKVLKLKWVRRKQIQYTLKRLRRGISIKKTVTPKQSNSLSKGAYIKQRSGFFD